MTRRTRARKGKVRRKRAAPWQKRLLWVLVLTGLFFGASGVAYFRGDSDSFAGSMEQTRALFATQAGISTTPTESIIARVERVVDGDTVIVEFMGKTERVRLLRIDTPESVHASAQSNHPLGRDASDFLRGLLINRQVRLQTVAGEERDNFDRMLAYVIADGQNINVEIVRAGWSAYETRWGKSATYDAEFRAAEKEARAEVRGIWGDREYLRRAGIE